MLKNLKQPLYHGAGERTPSGFKRTEEQFQSIVFGHEVGTDEEKAVAAVQFLEQFVG